MTYETAIAAEIARRGIPTSPPGAKTPEQLAEETRLRAIARQIYDRGLCPTKVAAEDVRGVAIVLADSTLAAELAVDVLLCRPDYRNA